MSSEFRKTDVIINDEGLPKDTNYHTAWRCKSCGTIVMSLHVHSWVACKCFKNIPENTGIFIDGGREYLRGGGNLDGYETLVVKIS